MCLWPVVGSNAVVEPMTTILVLAGKYGVEKVVAALTGDGDLAGIVAELFGELRASEDRIADRLSAIEGKLGVLLDQPYSIALGAGQRALLDAGVSADAEGRVRELRQARVYFREASAAARSRLQVATAERFLGLCCMALREPDAAVVAMRASRVAAFRVRSSWPRRRRGRSRRRRCRPPICVSSWSERPVPFGNSVRAVEVRICASVHDCYGQVVSRTALVEPFARPV